MIFFCSKSLFLVTKENIKHRHYISMNTKQTANEHETLMPSILKKMLRRLNQNDEAFKVKRRSILIMAILRAKTVEILPVFLMYQCICSFDYLTV